MNEVASVFFLKRAKAIIVFTCGDSRQVKESFQLLLLLLLGGGGMFLYAP